MASECFFKGHSINFFDWTPNCKEDNLDLTIPTCFSINLIPSELNQVGIIKRIDRSLGELISLDASFERYNNIKLTRQILNQ